MQRQFNEHEEVTNLYQKIADEEDMDVKDIRLVITSQFALLNKEVGEIKLDDPTTYIHFRINHFGVFCMSKGRLTRYFKNKIKDE